MASKGVPLQKSLLFNLAAGVVLLGATLLTISLLVTDRTIERLSGSLTNRVIATTDAQIMGFFEPVLTAIEITADRAFRGEFDDFPLDSLDRYFEPMIDDMPQLSSVMYAHDDGDEYMLLQSEGRWTSRLTKPETWGHVELLRKWRGGQDEKSSERRPLDYDSRERPWHQGAIERLQRLGDDAPVRDRIHWTAPYTFFTTREPGVTASVAYRVPSGQVVVLGFDILLADISRFTSRIEIGQRGKVFVLRGEPRDPQGLAVIGLPADERFADDASMIEFVLSPPQELGGAVASFVGQLLATNAAQPGKAVKFSHGGEAWWGEILQSKLRTSDDIWVGSIVPEAELLEGLPDSSLIVIVTTGIVLLLAMFRATWLARRYATPLEALTDRGNRMQRLNFEPVEPVASDITEIRHLSATLERMRAALQTFSAAREDLRVARSIRDLALPARLQAPPGIDIAVWHEASEDLGGECYDAVSIDTGERDSRPCTTLVAFDFPGAGVAAAVYGSQLRGAFRAGVRDGLALQAQAVRLDALVRGELPAPGPLSVTLLSIDAAHEVEILALGHGAALWRLGRTVAVAADHGAALGLEPPQDIPPATVRRLEHGDLVVLASDGVLDALDEQRRRYGLSGLEEALRAFAGTSADELLQLVRQDLQQFASGPRGDRTLIAICVQSQVGSNTADR